eukprot:3126338-Pyramimonas_sp.AAC.1
MNQVSLLATGAVSRTLVIVAERPTEAAIDFAQYPQVSFCTSLLCIRDGLYRMLYGLYGLYIMLPRALIFYIDRGIIPRNDRHTTDSLHYFRRPTIRRVRAQKPSPDTDRVRPRGWPELIVRAASVMYPLWLTADGQANQPWKGDGQQVEFTWNWNLRPNPHGGDPRSAAMAAIAEMKLERFRTFRTGACVK